MCKLCTCTIGQGLTTQNTYGVIVVVLGVKLLMINQNINRFLDIRFKKKLQTIEYGTIKSVMTYMVKLFIALAIMIDGHSALENPTKKCLYL